MPGNAAEFNKLCLEKGLSTSLGRYKVGLIEILRGSAFVSKLKCFLDSGDNMSPNEFGQDFCSHVRNSLNSDSKVFPQALVYALENCEPLKGLADAVTATIPASLKRYVNDGRSIEPPRGLNGR